MTEILALVLMAAALGAVVFFHATEAAAWRAERADLLNRIMARSYTDFVYTATATTAAEPITGAPEPPDKAWHDENMKEHPEQYPDGVVFED